MKAKSGHSYCVHLLEPLFIGGFMDNRHGIGPNKLPIREKKVMQCKVECKNDTGLYTIALTTFTL